MKHCLALGAALLLAVSASADIVYDSNGFEDPPFVLGPLNGQDGWYGEGGGGGIEPMVVTHPDPVIGDQAVRLEVPDEGGAYSYMDMAIPDILAQGYTQVTVSFDIYRQTDDWISNLWWWWFDAGTPTYGLQWDEGQGYPHPGATYPFGWDGVGTPTILDRYVTLEMIWDFDAGVATGYYDGNLVTTVGISDIETLTGWAIQLGHDEDTGSGPDVAWIDNFAITAIPEPASLALLGLGLATLLRRR
jgi:hypothetical protein